MSAAPPASPPTPPAILLATRSEGKLRELRPIFAAAGLVVSDLASAGMAENVAEEESLECYDTFEENALAKARYFFQRSGGVRPVVADDSGLEVFALGGRPGVRSKRWSGRRELAGPALDAANNAKLLAELASVVNAGKEPFGELDRSARYVCVAAYVDGVGERTFRGESRGRILHSPRGEGGFGYDPLFELEGREVTFAELDRAAKEGVSHRGRAFSRLVAALHGEC